MLPTMFRFIWPSGYRGEVFSNRPIRNKNCLWRPYLLMDRADEKWEIFIEDLPWLLPIKFRFIWPSGFRAELFLKIDQSETGITGSGLYRAPSIYASYQVSMHLAKQFQRKMFFLNRLIRNKNCLWWPCLLMDRNEMRNIYRGPSIVASYQVSVHLAKRFQRGIFLKNWPIRKRIACGGHVC
jgi:hypothetical protein